MTERSEPRVATLDGLRGVAASVVVLHHSLLAIPRLADAYRSGRPPAEGGSAWLVYSPLHLLWNGPAAVFVFFVLSGYVLTSSALRPSMSWGAYLPSRLVRLYLPTTAAVAWAVATFVVVPHTARPGASWWVGWHAVQPDPSLVAQGVLLMGGSSVLNSPLWSLHWEVLFSLLLPVYVVAVRRPGRAWCAALLVLLVAVGAGVWLGWRGLHYLPMFALGAVLAAQRERVGAWWGRAPLCRAAGGGAVVVALLLMSMRWAMTGAGVSARLPQTLGATAEILGALLLVGAAIWSPALRRPLGHPVAGWLGSRSFSVYLTHEPVAVCASMLLPLDAQWVVPLITIPLALLIGEGFFRLVERPSHRLSQTIGRRLAIPVRRRALVTQPS